MTEPRNTRASLRLRAKNGYRSLISPVRTAD
jgi:hypothetical protein